MKIFYVSYDVRDGGDYEKLISKLRELGGRNILRSTWSLGINVQIYACTHSLR